MGVTNSYDDQGFLNMSFMPKVYYKGRHVRNMITAAIPITAKVIQPTTLENKPFVLPSRTFLSLAIFMIMKSIGTATTPFMTGSVYQCLNRINTDKINQESDYSGCNYYYIELFCLSKFFA